MIQELIDIKQEFKKKNVKGIALDIDETLSFTLKYWSTKMAELFGDPEGLGPLGIIKKYRYSRYVPYWQSEEAKQWVIKAIYDNDLQERLDVIDGAVEYVNKINKIIPIVAYVTNRPVEVKKGTEKWLKKHGFPTLPILGRPKYVDRYTTNIWKAEMLNFLYPFIDGYVDDNYEVLDYLPKNYKGHYFLFDMAKHDSPIKNVYPCPNWPSVFKKVKEIY